MMCACPRVLYYSCPTSTAIVFLISACISRATRCCRPRPRVVHARRPRPRTMRCRAAPSAVIGTRSISWTAGRSAKCGFGTAATTRWASFAATAGCKVSRCPFAPSARRRHACKNRKTHMGIGVPTAKRLPTMTCNKHVTHAPALPARVHPRHDARAHRRQQHGVWQRPCMATCHCPAVAPRHAAACRGVRGITML